MRSTPAVLARQFALAVLVLDGVAWAEADEDAVARALVLFRLARIDMLAERYVEACPKFADSQRLDPGVGTMLNLAYCYEKLGKTASAWAEYQAAAAAAAERGKTEWESAAKDRARSLEGSLLRVVIHVEPQNDADGREILLDGTPLPKSLWEQPAPIDPGRHEVRAAASGRRPWSKSFKVEAEGVGVEGAAVVVVPVLEPADAPVMVARPTGGRPASAEAPVAPRGGGQRTAALVLGAAGVGALAIGAGLLLLAKSTYDGSSCGSRYCTTRADFDAQSRAITEANIATATFVAGGLSLVGAAVLWFGAPQQRKTAHLAPAMGYSAYGLSLQGDW
jgi:hypothetical protein